MHAFNSGLDVKALTFCQVLSLIPVVMIDQNAGNGRISCYCYIFCFNIKPVCLLRKCQGI